MSAPRGVTWRRPGPVAANAATAATATATAVVDAPAPPPSSPFADDGHASSSAAAAFRPQKPRRPQGPTTTPSLLHLAWRRYQAQLRARPLATKAITAAAIAALSDAAAQWIAASSSSARGSGGKKRPSYDPARTLKMALLGLVWSGPSAHYWQDFLQRAVPQPGAGASPERAAAALLKKVALDQFTYGPACNLVFMAYTTLVVAGAGLGELGVKVRRDFAAVQRNGWRVWPLCSAISYRFVPLEYRVLFANVVALGWTTYLNLNAR
jgi:peroxisomal membrane protein 2